MPLGTLRLEPRDSAEQSNGGEANGIIYTTPRSSEDLGAHLKCLYTNTYSMRNEWDEVEALILSKCSDIIGISETL